MSFHRIDDFNESSVEDLTEPLEDFEYDNIENLWGIYYDDCPFLNKGRFNEKFFSRMNIF